MGELYPTPVSNTVKVGVAPSLYQNVAAPPSPVEIFAILIDIRVRYFDLVNAQNEERTEHKKLPYVFVLHANIHTFIVNLSKSS